MTNGIIMGGQLAGALSAIGAVVFVVVKYAVVRPIQNYIDLRTDQIQSFSNGGKSLPDIAKSLESVHTRLNSISTRVEAIEAQIYVTTKASRKTV